MAWPLVEDSCSGHRKWCGSGWGRDVPGLDGGGRERAGGGGVKEMRGGILWATVAFLRGEFTVG